MRNWYQNIIAPEKNTKMTVYTALISGVRRLDAGRV